VLIRVDVTHIYLIECKPTGKVMQDSWLMEVS
jgi:hypothetical protein